MGRMRTSRLSSYSAKRPWTRRNGWRYACRMMHPCSIRLLHRLTSPPTARCRRNREKRMWEIPNCMAQHLLYTMEGLHEVQGTPKLMDVRAFQGATHVNRTVLTHVLMLLWLLKQACTLKLGERSAPRPLGTWQNLAHCSRSFTFLTFICRCHQSTVWPETASHKVMN